MEPVQADFTDDVISESNAANEWAQGGRKRERGETRKREGGREGGKDLEEAWKEKRKREGREGQHCKRQKGLNNELIMK